MEKVFESFEFERVVDQNTIKKYQGLLPDQLIEAWKTFGYGTLLEGYLKLIDPDEYQEILEETYFRGAEAIPIMTTAFADIITWEKSKYIGCVRYRYHTFNIISSGFQFFFGDLTDSRIIKDEKLQWQPYPEALALHGKPAYDQCFMNIPLLCLGGDGSPEKMQKGDLLTHIQLITEFTGPIA